MKDNIEDNIAISLNGVDVSLTKTPILFDININIKRGSIYGLLGPSGAGKTTTVKVVAGIIESEKGETNILGITMPNLTQMANIGYMAQSDALYEDLTGYENLEFFGELYGMKKKELKERIGYALGLVNLLDDAKKVVSKYSGGMKRRLALAAAVLHNPDILILDEPTVGIDPLLRKEIWDELYKICEQGTTILVTTHVMDEAEKCHKLAMMRNGRVIGEGTPQELVEQCHVKTLEEAFLKLSVEQNEGAINHEN